MVLVSCRILCGLLGSLTKILQSLQTIVSHTEMIYFSAAVWRIVFDRYYSTLRWRYFVFCKDRPRWRQRVFDLLPSNLLSASYFVAFSLIKYNIKAKFVPPLNNVASLELRQNWCSLLYDFWRICFLFWILHFIYFFDTRCFYVRSCVSCVLYRLLHQFNWLRGKRMFHAWSLVYTAALPFTFNTTPAFTHKKTSYNPQSFDSLWHAVKAPETSCTYVSKWLRPEQLRRRYTLWLL